MLPVNDLGSDFRSYFSLVEHPCEDALKRINRTVATSALWFRAQSRCTQKNDRPCVSVGTGTCTNPSTKCCSAKCFPLASESLREWIQVRQSVRQFQLHPDRQLANRTAHHCTNLRSNSGVYFRDLTPSWLSPKSAECVVVEVEMLSTSRPHSIDNYSSLSGFQRRNSTEGVHFGSVTFWRACSWAAGQAGSNKEEHIMSQSRGAVSFEPLFTAEDIGLRKEANVEHVMKVFITLGEVLASRWIEMPKGVLLLQSVPDDPASGAIYLYDRELQVFYFVVFDEGRDDSLTAAEFDDLVTEYNLVSWTAHPSLLWRAVGKPGMA